MQELLGRITRLDPEASLALRVIACFDELTVGHVNTRGLLAAAASLAGCPAGFAQDRPARSMRVSPRGELVPGPAPERVTATSSSPGLTVWLERDGDPLANDAIVLERLSLAVRMRHGGEREAVVGRRDLGRLLDHDTPVEERRLASAALGLVRSASYRVVVAPLFAVWDEHPGGPEDVVPTSAGPVHALVVTAATDTVRASPCGSGVATQVDDLHHSFRTALVALRLCDPPTVPQVCADAYAGLVDLLADAPPDAHQPDVRLIDAVAAHPWGLVTLDAVVRSGSSRQAARLAGVHHSTMQSRVETLVEELGFDPSDGFGRARAGLAYMSWRLRHSRVLDLPAPTARD